MKKRHGTEGVKVHFLFFHVFLAICSSLPYYSYLHGVLSKLPLTSLPSCSHPATSHQPFSSSIWNIAASPRGKQLRRQSYEPPLTYNSLRQLPSTD
ncbi:hypothetical protein E2C01_071814 [Portunus trituberculatus]|uniref:Uncharacterized protein n=1 Tax=Portunus trituberculatus TaxID=210409 RepID=A0A5B7I0X4_PORTR|nr:hypothetical protein [Portunus trituberculatus]